MNPRPGNSKNIEDRHDRACARLAHVATCDTILGGTSALVKAKRLERMHCRFPALSVVQDVYSRSTGRQSLVFGAWECGECGETYVGRETANACCQEDDYQEDD